MRHPEDGRNSADLAVAEAPPAAAACGRTSGNMLALFSWGVLEGPGDLVRVGDAVEGGGPGVLGACGANDDAGQALRALCEALAEAPLGARGEVWRVLPSQWESAAYQYLDRVALASRHRDTGVVVWAATFLPEDLEPEGIER